MTKMKSICTSLHLCVMKSDRGVELREIREELRVDCIVLQCCVLKQFFDQATIKMRVKMYFELETETSLF